MTLYQGPGGSGIQSFARARAEDVFAQLQAVADSFSEIDGRVRELDLIRGNVPQVRELVATEGQTVFAFLVPVLAGYVDVFLNGLRLQASDFTHSGATVTLAAGVAGGDVVTLKGFAPSIIEDALNIRYGSGTVADALGEVVSVKRFGAKGDGVTNDTAAFVAAIAAVANNGTIIIPAGNYVLASQVLVQGRNNIRFAGEGARIKGGATRFRSYFKLLDCSRMYVEGLTFDQMQPSLPIYTQADYASGFFNTAIEIESSQRVAVRDCSFDNLYTRSVSAYLSSDVDVSDNIFTSPVQAQTYNGAPGAQELQHVHFATCSGIRAANNRFLNAPITSPANGVCSIYASGIRNYAYIENNYSEYAGRDNAGTHRLAVIDFYGDAQTVRIVNNTSRFGMAQFARVSSTRGPIVAGNRVHASPDCELDYSMLTFEGVTSFAPGQIGVLDSICRDNLFEDSAQRHAFAVGVLGYDWGVPAVRALVQGNSFDGCRRSVLVRGPFYGVAILDNAMRGNAAGTILVDQQAAISSAYGTEANSVFRALAIRGNVMLDESGGSASAIIINLVKSPAYTGSIDDFDISRNTIRAKTPNGGQAIVVNHGVQRGTVRVQENDITGYAIGIYQRVAGAVAITGNRLLNSATPILDEGTALTVERRHNRYTTGAISGTATLVAGSATVPTAEVRSGDTGRIHVWHTAVDGTPGFLSAGSIADATSFVITSTSNTDTSTVRWQIDR